MALRSLPSRIDINWRDPEAIAICGILFAFVIICALVYIP